MTRDTVGATQCRPEGVACGACRHAGHKVGGGRVEGSGVCDTLLAVTRQMCDMCATRGVTQEIRVFRHGS